MPDVPTVDPTVVDELWETGIVRLRGVFSDDDAARMRDAVWRDLFHTHGVVRKDPSTWQRRTKGAKLARAKRDPSFEAMLGPQLRALADELLRSPSRMSGGYGVLLASFPDARRWHLPGRDGFWHSDCGDLRTVDGLPWLQFFALFGDVDPGGGGTLLVSGSHRLLAAYLAEHPEQIDQQQWRPASQRSIPWLAALTQSVAGVDAEGDEARRRRFMDDRTDVDGAPVRVVEACGRPGDVFVCHPLTIHCRPPNASDRPRFLRSTQLLPGGPSAAAGASADA